MRRTVLIAIVFALFVATRVAAREGTWNALPEGIDDAPECVVPPAVGTRGWKLRRQGLPVLLPPSFHPAALPYATPQFARWVSGRRHFEMADDTEVTFPFTTDASTQRCRTRIGEQDVLVFRQEAEGWLEMAFWLIQPFYDPIDLADVPSRQQGMVLGAHGLGARDVGLFWTIARTILEPYPISDDHRGAVDPEPDDLACPARLILERLPGSFDCTLDDQYDLSQILAARLENHGRRTVRLLRPGDASDRGWRNPMIALDVERSGMRILERPTSRCGSIDPLRPSDVIDLPPAHGCLLRNLGGRALVDGPGTYRVTMRYLCDPTLDDTWRSGDSAARARARDATLCDIVSNSVRIDIPPPSADRHPARRASSGLGR